MQCSVVMTAGRRFRPIVATDTRATDPGRGEWTWTTSKWPSSMRALKRYGQRWEERPGRQSMASHTCGFQVGDERRVVLDQERALDVERRMVVHSRSAEQQLLGAARAERLDHPEHADAPIR